jgi:thiol:disulfide interchange protein DsbA
MQSRPLLATVVALAFTVLAAPASAASAAGAGTTPPAIPGLVPGSDYTVIPGGVPLDTQAGQVEVAEAFNYACPACFSFSPLFRQWVGTLPKYAHVVYVPMDFRADFVQYAHAYYAAETLGVAAKSHDAVFEAVHKTNDLPGEGKKQESATIAKFYTRFGVDAGEFQRTMDSFSVAMKTTNAHQFAMRSRVESTPSLIIDGRYLVGGGSWPAVLQNASRIIAAIHDRTPAAK